MVTPEINIGDRDRISIEKVRRACLLLLDEAERRFGPSFQPQGDEYWAIDLRSAYSLVDDPSSAGVCGALTDDIAEMRDILERGPGELYLWHDLVHLIGLLGAIAYQDLPPAGK